MAEPTKSNKPSTWPRLKIFRDVSDERESQLDKWGVQHLADDTGGSYFMAMARDFKRRNDAMVREATARDDTDFLPGWSFILLEEVYEALAEEGLVRLREELIQAAAVIVAWVEDIDSREGR